MTIRKTDGTLVKQIVKADASALYAMGWQPPERIIVKAADNKTDLYGALFKPLNMDPSKKYAVIDHMYPGPQGSFGPQSFMDSISTFTISRGMQNLAELGFVGLVLDGRGTSQRDHGFRYAFAGTEDIYGAADHVAAIKNLAKQYSFMDVERIGVMGLSFGGSASARAILLYPDFFDVCVSYVGSHDQRQVSMPNYVERFFGIPDAAKVEGNYYDLISNTRLAHRLKGNLLLIVGELDENIPLANAMNMFDALIKADKNFDTLLIPNATHVGAFEHPYTRRRTLDYFVKHLGGPHPIQPGLAQSQRNRP